jgi:hypothetical protein
VYPSILVGIQVSTSQSSDKHSVYCSRLDRAVEENLGRVLGYWERKLATFALICTVYISISRNGNARLVHIDECLVPINVSKIASYRTSQRDEGI